MMLGGEYNQTVVEDKGHQTENEEPEEPGLSPLEELFQIGPVMESLATCLTPHHAGCLESINQFFQSIMLRSVYPIVIRQLKPKGVEIPTNLSIHVQLNLVCLHGAARTSRALVGLCGTETTVNVAPSSPPSSSSTKPKPRQYYQDPPPPEFKKTWLFKECIWHLNTFFSPPSSLSVSVNDLHGLDYDPITPETSLSNFRYIYGDKKYYEVERHMKNANPSPMLQTEEECIEVVRAPELKGMGLLYVPETLRTRRVMLEAARAFGRSLLCIPASERTAEICLAAVRSDGKALCLVPYEQRTDFLCYEACRNNGKCLPSIPFEFRTAEYYEAAVSSRPKTLKNVPMHFRTQEMCENAAMNDPTGEAFRYVPIYLRSYEMCVSAVRTKIWNIAYVPDRMLSDELLLDIVQPPASGQGSESRESLASSQPG